MKRVIIFGTGKFYSDNKDSINDEIIAFLDNDESKKGKMIDGAEIYLPKAISNLDYDFILLMGNDRNASVMRNQLISLGVTDEKIFSLYEYITGEKCKKEEICGDIVIISTYLNYYGGIMVEVYASQVLSKLGYKCVIVAPGGNKQFIDEMRDKGIVIKIVPFLPYIDDSDMVWINRFKYVIVNVFQMYPAVKVISKHRKLLWWLHEAFPVYKRSDLSEIEDIDFTNIRVMAVSEIAKRNFETFTGKTVTGLMPYGIPDTGILEEKVIEEKVIEEKVIEEKFIIAVIGNVTYLKGQDIFLKAIEQLDEEIINRIECWFIGGKDNDATSSFVFDNLNRFECVKYLGVKSRKEMEKLISQIDIVVMPSREDCLPIAITEGLMNKKVCLVSDNTGFAPIFSHQKNGFIFKKEDSKDLMSKLKWIIINKNILSEIREKGRDIYERDFTMEAFGKRLVSNLELAYDGI